MRDPCAVMTIVGFPLLIGFDFGKGFRIRLLIIFDRDLSCHSSHRVNTAAMAGFDT